MEHYTTFPMHCSYNYMLTINIYSKVYAHDATDIPQMKELGKSILPGVHTLASISYSQVNDDGASTSIAFSQFNCGVYMPIIYAQ